MDFWTGELSFGLFLLLIILSNFVMIPISAEYTLGYMISVLFWFFMIVAGTLVIIKNKKYLYIILLFILFSLIIWIIGYNKDIFWIDILERISQIFFTCILLFFVLVKVFEGGVVNRSRIIGSIAGYLLLGNLFYAVYLLIYVINGPSAFNIPDGNINIQLIYFSYTTLATLGYGDITPAVYSAMAVSNVEAITGQLYPAILIARLISLETAAKSNDNSNITPNE